jgi:hypothetical protein
MVFAIVLFQLSFLRKGFTTVSGRIVFLTRTLPRIFKVRVKARMGGLYTKAAIYEQGFSLSLAAAVPAPLLSANFGECYTLFDAQLSDFQ